MLKPRSWRRCRYRFPIAFVLAFVLAAVAIAHLSSPNCVGKPPGPTIGGVIKIAGC
jgi:hypothetical protein